MQPSSAPAAPSVLPTRPAVSLFPPLAAATLVTALLAGAAADVAWEVWARWVTPHLPGVGGPLEPAALVQSVFGLDSRWLAELLHLVVGVVFYPLGYLFIARPLQRAILPGLPWWLTAADFGLGLFVFALFVMAHLIAGLPAFLGWIPLAWASLAGHVLFGLVTGAVVKLREERASHRLA
ncbi:MAG TPA: hypothetical protein VHL31_09970 [Geminicoccus sp.]|uniref:hypothetical protein n=1 Tax=Geminicoccus sp. TaxID=2024832 RepID=UPI002E354503|nr:hypothetical protein [Geminicoccus sp.]HEX2526606.1 hypothetical protein [Geminicoccus sp.]